MSTGQSTSALATIPLADPYPRDRALLRAHLEQARFRVREAADVHSLVEQIEHDLPHLVVLDLELPSAGGRETTDSQWDGLRPLEPGVSLAHHRGREAGRTIQRCGDVPIVVLTAYDDEETRLEMLDRYAEDYILKPPCYPEVVARVRRVLRRTWLSCRPDGHAMRVDDRLCLDFLRREARTPEGVFRLTPLESRLLHLLVRNAGQLLPSRLLLELPTANRR